MTERKVKLDRANKSILLRALGDVYYGYTDAVDDALTRLLHAHTPLFIW